MSSIKYNSAPTTSKIKTRYEFIGTGTLIQAVALVIPFIGWGFGAAFGAAFQTWFPQFVQLGVSLSFIGIIGGLLLAVILFVIGSRLATKHECDKCRNPLASERVLICPVCKQDLF